MLREAIGEGYEAKLLPEEWARAEVVLKEEERKLASLGGLEAAVASRAIGVLRFALEESEASGLEHSYTGVAKTLLAYLERQVAARAGLKRACVGRDRVELRVAIVEGEDAGLEPKEMRDARRVVAEEGRKEAAQDGLTAAEATRDLAEIRAALAEGEAVGLGTEDSDMVLARRTLAEEERKVVARSALDAACERREEAELRSAIEEGQNAGLLPEEMARGKTIVTAVVDLHMALVTRSIQTIEVAIAEGQAVGLEEDRFKAARLIIEEEQGKIAARSAVVDACGTRDLDQCRRAIEGGQRAGLLPDEVRPAETVLAEELRKIAARAALEVATLSRDIPELQETVEEGTAAGLMDSELEDAKAVLYEENRKVAAREELATAMKNRDLDRLIHGVDEAERAGLLAEETEESRLAIMEAIHVWQLKFWWDARQPPIPPREEGKSRRYSKYIKILEANDQKAEAEAKAKAEVEAQAAPAPPPLPPPTEVLPAKDAPSPLMPLRTVEDSSVLSPGATEKKSPSSASKKKARPTDQFHNDCFPESKPSPVWWWGCGPVAFNHEADIAVNSRSKELQRRLDAWKERNEEWFGHEPLRRHARLTNSDATQLFPRSPDGTQLRGSTSPLEEGGDALSLSPMSPGGRSSPVLSPKAFGATRDGGSPKGGAPSPSSRCVALERACLAEALEDLHEQYSRQPGEFTLAPPSLAL